ncbi:MAG: hypothetical protein R3253_06755 [Longimicrobiales bacterium]|nr:hypothetical protein [Longimicrobiales bacterium]
MRRSALTVVALGTLLASGASAQDVADIDYEHLSFRGFGLEVGYMWPDRLEPARSYGIRFDMGYAGPGLRVLPSVTYTRTELERDEVVEFADRIAQLVATQTGGPPPDLDLGTIEHKDIALGLDAQIVWEVPLDLLTFGGLGVAAHFVDGDGPAIDGTFVENLLDSVEPGFNLHAGAEYPVTDRMRLYTVGRYEIMPDHRYFQVRVGWQFMTGPNAPGEGRGNE